MVTYVLEEILPDVLSPVRSDGVDHQGLSLDPGKDQVLVHSDAAGGLTVGVTGSLELVVSGLQGELVGSAVINQYEVANHNQ